MKSLGKWLKLEIIYTCKPITQTFTMINGDDVMMIYMDGYRRRYFCFCRRKQWKIKFQLETFLFFDDSRF